jgi:hypothetical protein
MRTLNFEAVLTGVCALRGVERSTLQTPEFRFHRDSASSRLEHAWQSDPWPELVRVAEVTPTLTSGINKATLATATYGEILNVYSRNPRVTSIWRAVPYRLYDDGTDALLEVPDDYTSVFVEYRIPKPELTGDAFDTATAYASGAQVFYSSSTVPGNFYDVVSATTAGETPVSASAKFSVVKLPRNFQFYLIRAVYADWLRSQDRGDEADKAEFAAFTALAAEGDKLYRQQNQQRLISVVSHTAP